MPLSIVAWSCFDYAGVMTWWEQLCCNHRSPLCCSPVTTSIGWGAAAASMGRRKSSQLGRRWAGLGFWPRHRPPPHLHSRWPDALLATMPPSDWLGTEPAALSLADPGWSARCCARRRLIHRNTDQSSAAPHHCDTELLRARKIPVLCFSLQKRTTKIGHKNGLWRGPGVIISENNSE